MSASSNPPDAEADVADPVIVVLTPDTATVAEALAARAAKRSAISARKRAQAQDRQAFGVTLMKIKNYEGAAGCFADACALWRTNPVAHCDLATAYLHLGRFGDAESAASAALALDPKLVEARYARAMARKGRGLARGAITDFETVLELAPENEAAQAAVRELRAAEAASAEPAPAPAEGSVTPKANGAGEGEGAEQAAAEQPPPVAAAQDEAQAAAAEQPKEEKPTPEKEAPEPEPDYALPLPSAAPRAPSDASNSDTSDAQHRGNGTPCLFYNHQGCARAGSCKFSHAPDEKSVRDGLGKNVCLYFLLGECKFGTKCIYTHARGALPAGGWWEDDARVEAMKKRIEEVRERSREKRARREAREAGAGAKGQGQGEGSGKGKPKKKRGRGGKGAGHGGGGGHGRGNGSVGGGRHGQMGAGWAYGLGGGMDMRGVEARMAGLSMGGMGMGMGYGEYDGGNMGFTDYDLNELAAQGVKPWDGDALAVLAALSY
ncbi:hypothetical protein B0H15DRAFT_932609 [Mycena belliarum]|uniref:C3H1-type domain-containing protein n=1 Tax=Mycena belliarum TaxID=1033014 RepID=A0AAD6XN26_9AGAR|nr:hypothetical protein B0H15DRAFT_932609 [Mycena belliae]